MTSEKTTGPERLIDPASPLPLYFQVACHLKEEIQSGNLNHGHAIASERELCERYEVSRPTVRQALALLLDEGLLERRRGVGTFVAQPKIRQPISSILGFTDRMNREGHAPTTRQVEKMVLSAAEAKADVRAHLKLQPTDQILRLVRLRSANQEPLLLQTTYLPLVRFPGLESVDLEDQSLYRTLRNRYRLEISHLSETLEPALARPGEAKLLGIKAKQPVMLMKTTVLDQFGKPFEYTISLARGDRCEHYIEFNFGTHEQISNARLRQTQLEVSL